MSNPTILWKDKLYAGEVDCNSVLHRVQSGVLPMSGDDMKKLAKYAEENDGDKTFFSLTDKEICDQFEIKHWQVFDNICKAHGRTMKLDRKDISLSTKCINSEDGTIQLEYPKIFRITGSPNFPTDYLSQLHILYRKKDNIPVEEFVKILYGNVTWFMVIEEEVCKVVVPSGWQIFYNGFVEHGALIDTASEFTTCTQIIGPSEWELFPTGRTNPLLEDTK
jgi:hypothetical protein